MNRKILTSLLIVGVVSGMMGMGTMANFSDTETSSGNTFMAGTLDLTLNEPGSFTGSISDVAPGEEGTLGPVELVNDGSVDADTLKVEWDVTDSQNGIVENEPADGVEDISSEIQVTVYYDIGGNGVMNNVTDDVQTEIGDSDSLYLSELDGETASFDSGMDSGVSRDMKMKLTLDEDADNSYQSDKSTIDVTFTLES